MTHTYIAGSDIVYVREAGGCPSIVGRVITITVVDSLKEIPWGKTMHSFLLNNTPLHSTSKPIRRQWHLVNNDVHYPTSLHF